MIVHAKRNHAADALEEGHKRRLPGSLVRTGSVCEERPERRDGRLEELLRGYVWFSA